jgi:hypothetical protein
MTSMTSNPSTFNETEWRDVDEEDDNMLVKLRRPQLREDFFLYL